MIIAPLYRHLASTLQALKNCREGDKLTPWEDRHESRLDYIERKYLPSGSGFDNATGLDYAASKPDRLVIKTALHDMDEGGGYDGWTHYTVTVTPSLVHGFKIHVVINGNNRKYDNRDYVGDTISECLSKEYLADLAFYGEEESV